MGRGKGHSGKNRFERDYYSRYIKTRDYEPTVDESLKFEDSNDSKVDYSISTTNKPRRLSVKYQIEDFIKENWIPGVVALIVIIGGYLMISSQVTMGKIETNIDNIGEDVKEIKNDIKETNRKIEEIDDKSKENSWKIDHLINEKTTPNNDYN